MKNKIAIGFILAASTALSFGSFTISAGHGTFTSQGEIQHFWLADTSGLLSQVTITLTSAASQNGTVITNQGATTGDFTGAITSNYTTLVQGGVNGGTVNLTDHQTETLSYLQGATYNLSANGTSTVTYTNFLLGAFQSATPGNGDIQATTLSSVFETSSAPVGLTFLTAGGSGSTSYTWDITYTIPEPSTALLGGLGLLALLRRRRA